MFKGNKKCDICGKKTEYYNTNENGKICCSKCN